ncbi:hypothetical protein L4C34_12630 [Vibrio profundum]|uniref:hypothetical protein n=1 Tax=Vibrio profundum TaxID=2910247 RepID=UPI003D152C94
MTPRNIHGDWTMSFENRIVKTELTGSFNQEATVVYVNEMKEHVLSSPGGLSLPWGILQNCQHWDMASLDAWGSANEGAHWFMEHNCIVIAFVFSKKVQQFAVTQGLDQHEVIQFFSDYDEAYQVCLDKIAAAQSQQDKQ